MMLTNSNPAPVSQRSTRNPQPATSLAPISDDTLLAAWHAADRAEADYAIKCLHVGLLLREKKCEILNDSPLRHTVATGRFESQNGDGFHDYLESVGICPRTAQRRMEVAERVAILCLGRTLAEGCPVTIDCGGASVPASRRAGASPETIPLSLCLAAPNEEETRLPAAALKFRQAVFDFMADKTLAEAARAGLDGDSPASRVTRAGAGKSTGGSRGEDRKEFEKFTGIKLKEITSFLIRTKKNPDNLRMEFSGWRHLPAAQQNAIGAAFQSSLEKWPHWLLSIIADKAKQELKLSEPERLTRFTQ